MRLAPAQLLLSPGRARACLGSWRDLCRERPPTHTHTHYTRESIFLPRDLLPLGLPPPHPSEPLRFTDFSGFPRELARSTLRADPAAPGQTCRSTRLQHLARPGPPEAGGLPEEESGGGLGSGRKAGEPWSTARRVGSTGVDARGKSFPFQVCLLARYSSTPHLPPHLRELPGTRTGGGGGSACSAGWRTRTPLFPPGLVIKNHRK